MSVNTQRYRATITFEYEDEVWEGDPTDLVELARLETIAIEYNIGALSYFAESPVNTIVTVVAVPKS